MRFRLVPKSSTLDDLELLQVTFICIFIMHRTWGLCGIFGGRALSNRPYTGLTDSQQHLELTDWIELTML